MATRHIIYIIAAALLLCASGSVLAASVDIGGEISQSFGYDTDSGAFTDLRSDYRVYMERDLGFTGKMHLSLKGSYDALNKASEIDLDEAYASIYLDNTDVTVGKQVISWGTADGINPTNTINPAALSLTDSRLKGKPVLAAQATHYGPSYDLTAVFVPAFVPLDVSDLGSLVSDSDTLAVLEGLGLQLPENNLQNAEWAVRLGTQLAGYDIRISYHYGWEDIPALLAKLNINPITLQPDPSSLTYEGRYRRAGITGLAAAGILGNMGIWLEAAYVNPDKLSLDPAHPLEVRLALSPNEPYLQAVLGIDHTFGNGIYAEAQYVYCGNGRLSMPYSTTPGQAIKPRQYLMNHLSYDFDMDNKLECTSIVSLDDKSAVIMPAYTRRLTQATTLKLGAVAFVGTDGEFSDRPAQVTALVRASF